MHVISPCAAVPSAFCDPSVDACDAIVVDSSSQVVLVLLCVCAQCCELWLTWIVKPGQFAPLPCKIPSSLVHIVLYAQLNSFVTGQLYDLTQGPCGVHQLYILVYAPGITAIVRTLVS